MQAFEYASPTTKQEAVALLAGRWGETEVLAGGTDLLSLMKNYVATPRCLVNIKGIGELGGIGPPEVKRRSLWQRIFGRGKGESGLRIGALVTLQELLENQTVREEYPALAQAAEGISSPQIRNVGTVGGELCQRPRCWYFRNGFGLLAGDEQGRALVPEGENKYHAILGNEGPAYFVHPSSLAPALVALGAKARLYGPGGQREVTLGEFFVVPKSEGERETLLKPNELLTEVVIPASARGQRNATYEVRQKEALDWPLATASVAMQMQGGKVASARIVLGHVAPIPWPATEAEQWLAGRSLDEQTAAQAGEAAVRGARPLSSNRYKVQLARVAVKRALLEAARGGKKPWRG